MRDFTKLVKKKAKIGISTGEKIRNWYFHDFHTTLTIKAIDSVHIKFSERERENDVQI